jgi:hypothetical protein
MPTPIRGIVGTIGFRIYVVQHKEAMQKKIEAGHLIKKQFYLSFVLQLHSKRHEKIPIKL